MGFLEQLVSQLDGPATERIGRRLGVDSPTASNAIQKALPMLLGGLARNTRAGGADALAGALDRDHDGTILDDLPGYVERGPGRDGAGILGHLFGGSRARVGEALGSTSRLDAGSAERLLEMLAPVVMGAMGREKRRAGLDASGLGALLGGERETLRRSGGGVDDLLTSLLDADGDGSIGDDLAEKGKNLLDSFLGDR